MSFCVKYFRNGTMCGIDCFWISATMVFGEVFYDLALWFGRVAHGLLFVFCVCVCKVLTLI